MAELKLQLVKEREARAQAEVSHVERMKLYQQMQEEAKKAVNQKVSIPFLLSYSLPAFSLFSPLHRVTCNLRMNAVSSCRNSYMLYRPNFK